MHYAHTPYGKVFVSVMGVDPGTGAYDGKTHYPMEAGRQAVPTSQAGPLLIKLSKTSSDLLLSELASLLLQEKSAYKDQLTQASNMWTGIPDKAGTPIAITMEQKFHSEIIQEMS